MIKGSGIAPGFDNEELYDQIGHSEKKRFIEEIDDNYGDEDGYMDDEEYMQLMEKEAMKMKKR